MSTAQVSGKCGGLGRALINPVIGRPNSFRIKWNCVVADTVQVEFVSTAKFPANREKNRNFSILVRFVALESLFSQ